MLSLQQAALRTNFRRSCAAETAIRPDVRKNNSPQLVTIPVHDACNKAYQFDEDYFVHTLMPFAKLTHAGNAIYKDVLDKYRAGKKVGLTRSVLNEFEPMPSGLVLPGGKVVKRFKGARIRRIAWKIVRGLYFQHQNMALPEVHPIAVTLTPLQEGQPPPEHFNVFMQYAVDHNTTGKDSYGKYQAVFAYRVDRYADETVDDVHDIHYWALLLWDTILLTVVFHDPACRCCQQEAEQS